jgi:hypothetical protein
MLDLSDRVRDAFLASLAVRTLNGAAASTEPARQVQSAAAYVVYQQGLYRQRGWQLEAIEYQTYDWR